MMDVIRTHGRRLTHQRLLVLDVLKESQEHLDAEMLYDRAKARDPNISLATIYRSLALLKEIGLVQEYQLGENHGHFEAAPDTPHYHFTCLKCGRVVEFEAPQVMEAAQTLCQDQDLHMIHIDLHLSGYCATCYQPDML